MIGFIFRYLLKQLVRVTHNSQSPPTILLDLIKQCFQAIYFITVKQVCSASEFYRFWIMNGVKEQIYCYRFSYNEIQLK